MALTHSSSLATKLKASQSDGAVSWDATEKEEEAGEGWARQVWRCISAPAGWGRAPRDGVTGRLEITGPRFGSFDGKRQAVVGGRPGKLQTHRVEAHTSITTNYNQR